MKLHITIFEPSKVAFASSSVPLSNEYTVVRSMRELEEFMEDLAKTKVTTILFTPGSLGEGRDKVVVYMYKWREWFTAEQLREAFQ